MGWVTNINFEGELQFRGLKISKGFHTQVRWDIGIGDINIDATGRIRSVSHLYPLEYKLEAKKAYEEHMMTFTGILDGTDTKLHFIKGQLVDADLFGGDCLEQYVMSRLHKADVNFSNNFHHEQDPEVCKGLDSSLSEEEGEKLKATLGEIRQQLDAGITFTDSDFCPETLKKAVQEWQRHDRVL